MKRITSYTSYKHASYHLNYIPLQQLKSIYNRLVYGNQLCKKKIIIIDCIPKNSLIITVLPNRLLIQKKKECYNMTFFRESLHLVRKPLSPLSSRLSFLSNE